MKMRAFFTSIILIIMLILLPPQLAVTQNQTPVVEQITATVDTTAHMVFFKYDVLDQEQDTLEITLILSNNDGESFERPIDSAIGDIGWPVLPGAGKQVVWNYNPDDLNPDAGTFDRYKIKIVADDHLSENLQVLVNQVDSLNLKANMQAIIGIRHYVTGVEHLANVKEYLRTRLSSGNLELIEQHFIQSEYSAENVIGMLPGQTNINKLYGIGGHYDTVETSPGADDNGSGVAGMLEVARILSDYQFRYSLQFIAFDLEETGMYGSKEYVRLLRQDSTDFTGMINMDMIGYYSNQPNSQEMRAEYEQYFPEAYNAMVADEFRANFANIVTNSASSELQLIYNSCASQLVPQLKVITFPVPGNGEEVTRLRSSDHASFWDYGYKAIMINDTANLRNHIYHSPADTIGTLNFTFMTNIVKAAVATMARLGEIQHYGFGITGLEIAIPNSIAGQEQIIPMQFRLEQNYPNPFNPYTRIDYYVPKAGNIALKIYSLTGQEIQTLVHKFHKAGAYSLNFYAGSLPSGLYLYTLQAGNRIVDCKKMLLIK